MRRDYLEDMHRGRKLTNAADREDNPVLKLKMTNLALDLYKNYESEPVAMYFAGQACERVARFFASYKGDEISEEIRKESTSECFLDAATCYQKGMRAPGSSVDCAKALSYNALANLLDEGFYPFEVALTQAPIGGKFENAAQLSFFYHFKAGKGGETDAMASVAEKYLHGTGTTPSAHFAKKWIECLIEIAPVMSEELSTRVMNVIGGLAVQKDGAGLTFVSSPHADRPPDAPSTILWGMQEGPQQ